MFERFGDDARRVVVHAQEEARFLDHDHIGTEHLLLGLVHSGEGIAGQALRWFEVTLPAARAAVEGIVGRGGTPPSGHVPFTRRAKTVLEHSLREALRLDDDRIGAEHLLLALVLEGDGVGCQVLTRLGAAPDAVAAKLLELRGGPDAPPDPKAAVAPAPMRPTRRGPVGAHGVPPPVPRCSFCRRRAERAHHVLVAGGVLVCDQCVVDAAAQLDALPEDAPRRVRFVGRGLARPDDRATVEAIQRAFDTVLGPWHVPPSKAFWAVEGGAELEELLVVLDEASGRAPVVVNDITVERVRFVDEDEAEIGLGLWMANSTAPMVQPAHAILEDGTWKVSRSTVEHFARQAQQFARPPD